MYDDTNCMKFDIFIQRTSLRDLCLKDMESSNMFVHHRIQFQPDFVFSVTHTRAFRTKPEKVFLITNLEVSKENVC